VGNCVHSSWFINMFRAVRFLCGHFWTIVLPFVIVLSVLLFTAYDYPVGALMSCMVFTLIYPNNMTYVLYPIK
jgi:hypothetical protein